MLPLLKAAVRRALVSQPMATAYHGRANGFGALRLAFALAVVLSHTAALGFGRPLLHRVDLGALAVAGFFTISGFLVVGSARRNSVPRFLWHRALRIWPGLWVCLLFTGLVVAPLLYLDRHGTVDGLWRSPGGVLDYLRQNWWGGLRQFGIADLLRGDTPYWHWQGGNTINGSLWTLAYEIYCYLAVAVLAALTVLRRQLRWLTLLAVVAVFGVLCWNHLQPGAAVWTSGAIGPLPMLGALEKTYLLWYGFMFLAGGAAELYRDRLPMNDLLGVLALGTVGWLAARGDFVGPGPNAADGAFFAPALLAYAYAVLWLAVRLPRDAAPRRPRQRLLVRGLHLLVRGAAGARQDRPSGPRRGRVLPGQRAAQPRVGDALLASGREAGAAGKGLDAARAARAVRTIRRASDGPDSRAGPGRTADIEPDPAAAPAAG